MYAVISTAVGDLHRESPDQLKFARTT